MPKKELEEWAIYEYHLEGEDQLKKEKEKSMYSASPLFLDYQNGWFILHATDTVRAKFYEDNKGEILTEIETDL